jgi:predicted SAM-dependent methyltransferase
MIAWDGAKLHLGCGDHPLAGWINVDGRPGAGVNLILDVQHDLDMLPAGVLQWVYTSHVVEHIAPDLLPGVLAHLYRALRPGGVLTVATISLEGIFHNAYEKGYDPKAWNSYLYGNSNSTDNPFMAHRQCFTYQTLTAALNAAGFATVRPWTIEQYADIFALNDCARSSYHVTVYAEGVK